MVGATAEESTIGGVKGEADFEDASMLPLIGDALR